jgi:hypothetical protein
MKETIQYILSSLTAFVIAGGGSIISVVGSGYELNGKTWAISCVIGAMAASKDIRSLMRMPPVITGNTEFLNKPTTKETKP